MRKGDHLRLLLPVDGLTPEQRFRAAAIGTRVERQLTKLLADGADPDRLLTKIEEYFPG